MGEKRKDNKGRNLRTGEYQRTDGIYQFKYTDSTGKKRVIYSKNLAELRVKEEAVKQDLKDGIKTRAEVNLTVNDAKNISQNKNSKLDIYNAYVQDKVTIKADTITAQVYDISSTSQFKFGKVL